MQQLDLFPTELFLRRIEPELNMWRFYLLRIEPDLFGEWCLRRRWGRIGTYGQEKLEWFESAGAAHDACEELARIKRKRGYH